MAGRFDFECEQGATFTRNIILKDSAGVVIDITGSTADMQVRETVQATSIIVELSTTNGRIVIDGPNGKLTLTISAADTAAITINGVYDIKVTYASGTIDRILEGEFVVDPQVTQ